MSNTNTNVRSLRDKFQLSQVNQYDNVTKQQHDISFQCIHCGKHQTLTILLQADVTQEIPATKANDYEPKPPATLREVSPISEEEQEDTIPPLHRSNYSLEFRHSDEDLTRSSIEPNIKGLIDNCVRSSLHDLSQVQRESDTREVISIDIEYDPILGNVRSTRKRSSTMTTNLDNDYRPINTRHQSVNSRIKVLPTDSDSDSTKPIWARRRISHSTVKPSDLIREYDKREKLEANALRRLSRADTAGEGVVPNSTIRPAMNPQSPAMIKEKILRWCQDLTQFYKGVNIRNFSSSWSDGLAFCAIIHRYFPDEFNFEILNSDDRRQNFDLAFTVALERAGVEPLIDTDDMMYMGDKPDWKVVFTYVQSLYRHLSRTQPPATLRERW
ncbi:unnamed protein product [Adineta ricciae]|uniref:Calponin-homology (CH) domain-containing protein n=1 Tax=Adineta ricciae TaxID=249248 RepID=A0A814SYV1_ADIRI|nr:unnamed protein product [Adineta ricciae]CAF1154345.1 unnamed protein product [Adineta ricciae]